MYFQTTDILYNTILGIPIEEIEKEIEHKINQRWDEILLN